MRFERKKAQAALDMLITYGVAILIISVALYVVLELGIFNNRLAPIYCDAAPPFSCSAYAIAANGNLSILVSQSTTAEIDLTGIACSTQANTTSLGPKYGNANVLSYSSAPKYYPTNQLLNGLVIYPNQNVKLTVNCYSGSGLAQSGYGHTFTGYVWFNYTINNLPSSMKNVEQVISFTAKYS